ncbi:MAG: DUF2705 family protein [Lachnospiraceae bacterium]|nr:DUF2705 family protein [Lachnospiraceae bacterium]
MRFCRTLRYDIRECIFKNKRFLLIPPVFCLQCFWTKSLIFNIDSALNGTYLDYLFSAFLGDDPIFGERGVDIPVYWVFHFFLSAFITTGLVQRDLGGFGQQVIIREKSRKQWWLSKCVTLAISGFVYVLIADLSVLIFCLFNRVKISLHTSEQVMESLLESDTFLMKVPLVTDSPLSIAAIFMMPALVIITLNAVQMLLSLIWEPVFSFLAVNCYVLLSVYISSPVAIGGYAMLCRSSLYMDGGLNPLQGAGLCLAVTAAAFLAGGLIFQRKDII